MGIALGMEYTNYIQEGEAIMSRTTATDRFLETLNGPFDPDVYAAAQDDNEVAGFARFQMEMNGLPAEQFPVIHRIALVMREESKTRVEWCRYFRLTVDEAHSEILPTNFATDPSFFAICRKLPYRTYVPSLDASEVTSRFKNRYCSICSDREPKR